MAVALLLNLQFSDEVPLIMAWPILRCLVSSEHSLQELIWRGTGAASDNNAGSSQAARPGGVVSKKLSAVGSLSGEKSAPDSCVAEVECIVSEKLVIPCNEERAHVRDNPLCYTL